MLELDCGNSLIKWRLLDGAGAVESAGIAEERRSLLALLPPGRRVERVRMVSVRGETETEELAEWLRQHLQATVMIARPALALAGVRNGYLEHERLGMDRWLAVVAAWQRIQGPVLVLDLGTAVTADLVDATGQHLGGYIGPGLGLMRRSLLQHTSRIRYEPQTADTPVLLPGTATREAVEHGCRLMLRGFLREQVHMARELLGERHAVILTGGDAGLLDGLVENAIHAPDLVFEGLALACPGSLEEGCV